MLPWSRLKQFCSQKIAMKPLYTALKINIFLTLLALTMGQGGMTAMAEDSDLIPLLPGIESSGVEALVPVQEPAPTIIQEEAKNTNVVVGQIPNMLPEKEASTIAQPSEAALTVAKPVDPTATEAINKTLESIANNGEDENLFYDADSLIPQGEFVKKGGTIKINPRTQPASKFVVVRKNSSANSLKARLVSASRAINLGRYDSALAIYDSLYKYNKRDPQILMGRALALQHMGRIDESLMAYNDFLDRKPKDINARVNMLGLMVRKYPAVALRHLMDLHEKHEGNVGVIAQIAVTHAQMGHHAEALKYFGIAAGMEPRNASHLFNMAIVTDKAGDTETAVTLYEKALEVDAVNGSGSVPRETIYERLAQLR